jgi:hypothetical protein
MSVLPPVERIAVTVDGFKARKERLGRRRAGWNVAEINTRRRSVT